MDEISSLDNMYLAYWKARKGKDYKTEVIDFAAQLDDKLTKLSQQIANGNIIETQYHKFYIYEPKQRLICSAPFETRVLHHAIMNVCGPFIDKRMIFDSYACRSGKGQYKAIEKACLFHRKFNWCIKMDIRKFFDNIAHEILMDILAKVFKESRLLDIFKKIIESYNSGTLCKGLPIGNLTSQYFANLYLDSLDHFIKEKLHAKGYLRYMDDMLLYGDDLNVLHDMVRQIKDFVGKKLHLDFKVMDRRSTRRYTSFLGYRISNTKIVLSHNSARRFRNKLHDYVDLYNNGVGSQLDLKRHLLPLYAFVNHADSTRLKQHLYSQI